MNRPTYIYIYIHIYICVYLQSNKIFPASTPCGGLNTGSLCSNRHAEPLRQVTLAAAQRLQIGTRLAQSRAAEQLDKRLKLMVG